jgi:3-oxoacyl-[acyl-carrier-protein] synthase II
MVAYGRMNARAGAEVLITGFGCISGLGIGAAAHDAALFTGRSALRSSRIGEAHDGDARVAAHIDEFVPEDFISAGKLRRIDRVGQLAIAACRLALEDAGLLGGIDAWSSEVGVALGTSTSGLHTVVSYLDRLNAGGAAGASALDFSNTVGNASASLCGIEFGLRGMNVTLTQREASAFSAIDHGASVLQKGAARAIVAGGVDDFESLYMQVHDRFNALARDEGQGEASRPFDKRRNGMVLGSGAFLMVLERADSARERGVQAHGSLAGIGASSSRCDTHGWSDDPSQLIRCMREALARADASPADVAVVFASANSSRQLDRTEARALETVFGPYGVPVVAVKGALGEAGATAAAGIVAAALALKRRMIPPTVGFGEADPECRVDVSAAARPLQPGRPAIALVNSCASGGGNYSVVIRG